MRRSSGSTRQVEQFLLPDGRVVWLLERRLFHRFLGPAVTHPDGRQEWWYLGELQEACDVPGPIDSILSRDEYLGFSEVPIPAFAHDVRG